MKSALCICIFAISISLLLACKDPDPNATWGSDYELNEKSFSTNAMTFVKAKSGLSLPNEAKGLRFFHNRNAIDPSFVAKLQIPDSSRTNFLKQLTNKPSVDVTILNALSSKVEWWNPNKKNIVAKRMYKNQTDLITTVLCVESNTTVIYIECTQAL